MWKPKPLSVRSHRSGKALKLAFAPSAKRIIPYPPVGISLLASSLRLSGHDAEVFDLEIQLADLRRKGEDVLLYDGVLSTADVLSPDLAEPVRAYGEQLWQIIGGSSGTDVLGISVMGFEQSASALLLARLALAHGMRVIFGGQFWTERSASEVIHALAPFGAVTVTVGDGWESTTAFVERAAPETIPNSYTTSATPGGAIIAGPRKVAKSLPPQPVYDWVPWRLYENFGISTYKNPTPTRRAHLYVWDKQCNFRCAFCRVATGSRAVLTPPKVAIDSFADLAQDQVDQLNFMTNELNPSRKYLLRFLDELEARGGGGGTNWFTYIRADRLEAEEFGRIRQNTAGLARYGVESGSQRLLDLMRKDYDVPTMSTTLRHAAAEDISNFTSDFSGRLPRRDRRRHRADNRLPRGECRHDPLGPD